MINTYTVSDVYAEAFFDTAFEQGKLEIVLQDLLLVKQCFEDSPLLLIRLSMPSLNKSQRLGIIDVTFTGKISSLTMRLLKLLVQRGRTNHLSVMYDAVLKVRDKREQIIDVMVTSAVSISIEYKKTLEEKIKTRFGEKSRVAYTTDPELIAGYRITTSEKLMDCSIRTGLERLRKQLLHC